MDYKNGKIYKIVSDLTDMIYIGSTTQPLYKRYYEHIKGFKNGHNTSKSVEIIKHGETHIELIEDFPCERKEQLNAREGYYIRLNKDNCVNRCIAGRTRKEYRNEKKEEINAIKILYRENNRERLRKEAIKYREENQIKINELRNEKRLLTATICSCGGKTNRYDNAKHIKSKKHLSFILQSAS